MLQLVDAGELAEMRNQAFLVNRALKSLLEPKEILLVDFKLEFGRDENGSLLLADEISPDTCRFWDTHSGEKLDKDRFRQDLGGVTEAYREIFKRLSEGS